MLKIALHCDAESRKLIEPELTDYMTKNNIDYEIYHVGGASKFLNNYFFEKDFELLFVYKNNSLQYALKTYHNHEKNYMHMVSGTLKMPLNEEILEKEIYNHIENSYRCPYGAYIVSNKTIFRRILHEDIEYIHRDNYKSVIYLKNGETEETRKSINTIKKELNERYFVKCCKGYLVNMFNVKQANKDTHTIKLLSGATIPLTKRNFQEFLRTYIASLYGHKLWDD